MRSIRFDHIALAVPRLVDAQAVLEGELGGASTFGAVHRFLAQRGPGIHHVTFTVPDLREVCERARAHSYSIVGYDDSDPEWKEAFLHPREALGIVVQLAEPHPEASSGSSLRRWQPPPGPANPPPPVTMLGLRLRARFAERAQTQWGAIVHGERDTPGDGTLVYRWPGSFMRITVEIDPEGEEGPIGIEYTSDRPVGMPDGPHPVLGAVFERR